MLYIALGLLTMIGWDFGRYFVLPTIRIVREYRRGNGS